MSNRKEATKKSESVRIDRDVLEKIRVMRHPGQTISGVLHELLEQLTGGKNAANNHHEG